MKVGNIVKPNTKGQIVIPKKIREALGIRENVPLNLVVNGEGIYLHPIKEVNQDLETTDSFIQILKKTQGSWARDDWPKTEKRGRRIELEASKRRKKGWY